MSVDWKRRALAAEGKLAGYRALRSLVDLAITARAEDGDLDSVLDELAAETCMLDEVDPIFDPFEQTTKKLSQNLTIKQASGMREVSRMDFKTATIELNVAAPPVAKLVGLVFQLVQLADLSCARTSSGIPSVTPSWIQDRAPSLLVLLIATGLLNPAIPVDVSDVAELAASASEA